MSYLKPEALRQMDRDISLIKSQNMNTAERKEERFLVVLPLDTIILLLYYFDFCAFPFYFIDS